MRRDPEFSQSRCQTILRPDTADTKMVGRVSRGFGSGVTGNSEAEHCPTDPSPRPQSSTFKPVTRPHSRVFDVTSVAPWRRAWPETDVAIVWHGRLFEALFHKRDITITVQLGKPRLHIRLDRLEQDAVADAAHATIRPRQLERLWQAYSLAASMHENLGSRLFHDGAVNWYRSFDRHHQGAGLGSVLV